MTTKLARGIRWHASCRFLIVKLSYMMFWVVITPEADNCVMHIPVSGICFTIL